jgi:hypothetical protein
MDIQGLNQNLLDHNSYANSVLEHNQAIQAHNDMVLKTFNDAESKRKEYGDIDNIWHSVTDPLKSGFNLMTLASTIGEARNFEDGVGAYISSRTQGRVGDIIQGGKTLFGIKDEGPDDPLGAAPKAPGAFEKQARLNIFGAGDEGNTIFNNLSVAQKSGLIANYAQPTPTALTHLQSLKDANTTANGDSSTLLGRVLTEKPPAEPVVAPTPNVPESKSSIPTSLQDVVARTSKAFGVDEAKASAVGNIAGKVGGVASGVSAVYQMATGKDTTGLEKASGILDEVGAGLDLVGTAIPVLEPLGAVATTAGNILGGISDYVESGKEQVQNISEKAQNLQNFVTAQVSTKGEIGGATMMKLTQGGGSLSF